MPSILFFGATGFVGSHVVLALKKAFPTFPLTIYIRNPNVDEYMTRTVGVDSIVHGTFDETEKIRALATEHDIVVDCASSDISVTNAIIAGLNQRPTGSTKIFHHMSGAGNFVDGGLGEPVVNAHVFNDANEDDMKMVNPSMVNGKIDVEVLEAGKNGIDTYIVFPTGIYGPSAGPVKSLGGIQTFMVAMAKTHGFVPYIGSGTNIINSLHVLDVAPFLVKMLEFSLSDEPKGSVYERCYIIGSQNDPFKDICAAFARIFHAKGIVSSPEAKSITLAETSDLASRIWRVISSSVLVKNERAVKLGYKATQPSWLESVHEAFEGYDI